MFGGSFNPVHIGHIMAARQIIEQFNIDKMYIVPTNIPPHKTSKYMISATHRLNMCEIAFKNMENVVVSDIEIKRTGASYTIDTLKTLSDENKSSEMYLVMGADMFLTLQSWKNPHEIFNLATICAIPREDMDFEKLNEHKEILQNMGAKCKIIKDGVKSISSTKIRDNLKNGKDITRLTGKEICKYINDNNLYME